MSNYFFKYKFLPMNLFISLSMHSSIYLSIYLSICLYIYHTWKNFYNDGNQKFRRCFPLILGWFWPFYVISWRFASFLAILRRFLPRCVVFSHKTTTTSCQDADFFPGMISIYVSMYLSIYLSIYFYMHMYLYGK